MTDELWPIGLGITGLARIVSGIDVFDRPRPDAVQLDDRPAVGIGKVRCSWFERKEAAGRQGTRLVAIGCLTSAEVERARDHRHDFRPRMGVWSNVKLLSEPETHGEQSLLTGIAIEHSHLRALLQGSRPRLPFDLLRRHHHVLFAGDCLGARDAARDGEDQQCGE
jgi:hypothetical protein